MKTTPEGKVKLRVRKALAECPVQAYLFMPVQNGMGASTLDFMGCIGGHFFAIETKAGYGGMTPRQLHVSNAIRAAGGTVFLLNEDPVRWEGFKDWLMRTAAIVALEEHDKPRPLPEWAAKILNSKQG